MSMEVVMISVLIVAYQNALASERGDMIDSMADKIRQYANNHPAILFLLTNDEWAVVRDVLAQ